MLIWSPGSAASSADVVVVSGASAVVKLMDDIGEKIKTGSPVDLGDLKVVDAFGWIMTPEQKATQAGWLQNIFKGKESQAASARVLVRITSATASGSKASSAMKRNNSSNTMDLFKKKRSSSNVT